MDGDVATGAAQEGGEHETGQGEQETRERLRRTVRCALLYSHLECPVIFSGAILRSRTPSLALSDEEEEEDDDSGVDEVQASKKKKEHVVEKVLKQVSRLQIIQYIDLMPRQRAGRHAARRTTITSARRSALPGSVQRYIP